MRFEKTIVIPGEARAEHTRLGKGINERLKQLQPDGNAGWIPFSSTARRALLAGNGNAGVGFVRLTFDRDYCPS